MKEPVRVFRGALVGSLALLVGCAHLSASRDEAAEKPTLMVVTGSRIPQKVDPQTGMVGSCSPVFIYTRQDLERTGRPDNLAAAMSTLDLSSGR
jgi:hypothetical protein